MKKVSIISIYSICVFVILLSWYKGDFVGVYIGLGLGLLYSLIFVIDVWRNR